MPNDSVAGDAVTAALAAAAMSSRPAPSMVGPYPSSPFVEPTSSARTSAALSSGRSWRSSAAAPATAGDAMLVPDSRATPGAHCAVGQVDSISTPGATRSGARVYRGVGPCELNAATRSVTSCPLTLILTGAWPRYLVSSCHCSGRTPNTTSLSMRKLSPDAVARAGTSTTPAVPAASALGANTGPLLVVYPISAIAPRSSASRACAMRDGLTRSTLCGRLALYATTLPETSPTRS